MMRFLKARSPGFPTRVALAVVSMTPRQADRQPHMPGTDLYGDQLPAGAVSRLGTLRWRLGSGIHSIAFAPDGASVLVAGDGSVREWELATGKELRRIPAGTAERSYARFLPDANTLLNETGGYHRIDTIQLWDFTRWKEIRRWERPKRENPFSCFQLSPDGTNLVIGDDDGTLHFQDAATGKDLWKSTSLGEREVVFSPDGKTLATAYHEEIIDLWDRQTGKELRHLKGHERVHHLVGGGGMVPSISMRFSPDGKILISSSADGTTRLWDVASGKEVRRLESAKAWLGHVLYSPDARTLVITNGKAIDFYDADTFKLLRQMKDVDTNAIAFSSDGKRLALGGERLQVLDLATQKDVLPEFNGHDAHLRAAFFLAGGATLLTLGADSTVRFWDAATGREKWRFKTDPGDLSPTLSPDQRLLALGEWNGHVSIWDLQTCKRLLRWQAESGLLNTVAFSPDGKTLATGGYDKVIRLWEAATGTAIGQLKAEGVNGISLVAFSPDGKLLASLDLVGSHVGGDGGDFIRLWDVASGKEVGRLTGPEKEVTQFAFSSDGRTLASVAYVPPIRLWDVATTEQRGALPVPTDRAWRIALSPDGRWLVSDGGDEAIHVWDLAFGKELQRLQGFRGGVKWLAFSPNGRRLVSAHGDTTALVWDLQPAAEKARRLAEAFHEGQKPQNKK
jgi:WD40 repeat protein